MLEEYKELLSKNIPDSFNKYLKDPFLIRLKGKGYFCGMDYASKDIYNFLEYVSRYDHSITTAKLTWYLKNDFKAMLAALYHDIATPCFSHVIDYMNKDYATQSSTEEKTKEILENDLYLLTCLKVDKINLEDIIDFKKYSIVDLERPSLCADRLDGIFLSSLFWTQKMKINDIKNILANTTIYQNKNHEDEIGFKNYDVGQLVLQNNDLIDLYCHSNEDNYMMELLAKITKYSIRKNIITYDDLYLLSEQDLIKKLLSSNDSLLLKLWQKFTTIKQKDIPKIDLPNVKKRIINPLIKCKRFY